MDTGFLEQAGLGKNEAKVYYTLLREGKANAANVSRKCGVHRVNVYDVLASLEAKGLVSQMPGEKQRLYQAENPQQLRSILQERLGALEERLPELEQHYQSHKEAVEVRVLTGPMGKKRQLEESFNLGKGNTIYLFLSNGLRTQELYPYKTNLRKFYVKLKGTNTKVKIIAPDTPDTRKRAKFFTEFRDFVEIKFVKGMEPMWFSWQVIQDTVGLTILTEPIVTIQIKTAHGAQIFRSQFEMIWKKN